jgi:hypothetical protein
MPDKKGFIDRDILQSLDSLARLQFKHPVDEEEGVAVRKPLKYFVNIHHDANPTLQCSSVESTFSAG